MCLLRCESKRLMCLSCSLDARPNAVGSMKSARSLEMAADRFRNLFELIESATELANAKRSTKQQTHQLQALKAVSNSDAKMGFKLYSN